MHEPGDLARRLLASLDARVVGHAEAKLAGLLGLVAREHVVLEGPPGCGKTLLAGALAELSPGPNVVLHFHRESRGGDLEQTELRREPAATRAGGGERLRERTVPAPASQARFLVLDDLDRAPGEVGAKLLPLLGERRLGGRPVPLETVVATASSPALGGATEPLDAGLLERLPLRVRLRGHLVARKRRDAEALLDLAMGPAPKPTARAGADLAALRRGADRLDFPSDVREIYGALLVRLRAAGADLSDSSFGRVAPGVLRAHAALRGAARVEPEDLRALRFLLLFRVPGGWSRLLDALLDSLIDPQPAAVDGLIGPAVAEAAAAAGDAPGAPGAGEAATAAGRAPGVPTGTPDARRSAALPSRPRALRSGAFRAAAVGPLMRALEGWRDRGRAEPEEQPGGLPRRRGPAARLEDLADADPVELVRLVEGTTTTLGRYRRERRERAGRLVLLRDVSASMEGRLGRWAGQVVLGVVRAAARRRVPVGYVEFSDAGVRFESHGRFFSREYAGLAARAEGHVPGGRTSYEAPLRIALDELAQAARERAGPAGHVVLLTDGLPVAGDPEVRAERARARALGVQVHTVFLGLAAPPATLERISSETSGVAFLGRPGRDGRLELVTAC